MNCCYLISFVDRNYFIRLYIATGIIRFYVSGYKNTTKIIRGSLELVLIIPNIVMYALLRSSIISSKFESAHIYFITRGISLFSKRLYSNLLLYILNNLAERITRILLRWYDNIKFACKNFPCYWLNYLKLPMINLKLLEKIISCLKSITLILKIKHHQIFLDLN